QITSGEWKWGVRRRKNGSRGVRMYRRSGYGCRMGMEMRERDGSVLLGHRVVDPGIGQPAGEEVHQPFAGGGDGAVSGLVPLVAACPHHHFGIFKDFIP